MNKTFCAFTFFIISAVGVSSNAADFKLSCDLAIYECEAMGVPVLEQTLSNCSKFSESGVTTEKCSLPVNSANVVKSSSDIRYVTIPGKAAADLAAIWTEVTVESGGNDFMDLSVSLNHDLYEQKSANAGYKMLAPRPAEFLSKISVAKGASFFKIPLRNKEQVARIDCYIE